MRALKTFGRIIPESVPEISEQRIVRRAKRLAGVDRDPDSYLLHGLRRLIICFKEEGHSHFIGRKGFQQKLQGSIYHHLLIEEYLANHPQILKVPLPKPIFIIGLPGSGTSLLLNLLAQDSNARALAYWQSIKVYPAPDPNALMLDPRVKLGNKMLQGLYRLVPELADLHREESLGPTDCNRLFSNSLRCPVIYARFGLPSYARWLLQTDMEPAYAAYQKQLQILSWKQEPHHRLQKAVMHLAFLDSLLEKFPDATLLFLHHDLKHCIPASCTVVGAYRKITCDDVDSKALGREYAAFLGKCISRYLKVRAAHEDRFFDITYPRLISNPIGVVKEIYDRFGYAYDSHFERGMTQFMGELSHIGHAPGIKLRAFGMDEAFLEHHFGAYLQRHQQHLDL